MDRVEGFLEAQHFYDPLHRTVYEIIVHLSASGKLITPITLKPYFENAEPIDAGLTVPQYLVRLAVNATTIINAREYGNTIRDLATRRQLILIGEDVVNAAYDTPVDFPPGQQVGEAQRRRCALTAQPERAPKPVVCGGPRGGRRRDTGRLPARRRARGSVDGLPRD